MGTVNDITSLAYAQLGNDGARYWNWYTDNVRPSQGYYVNGSVTPYCAEYISWLLAMTDTECAYFPTPVAFGRSDIPSSDMVEKTALKIGDIVSYNFDSNPDADHVGLVKAVYSNGITANEGNVSGYVRERFRPYSQIIIGVRPRYAGNDKLIVDGIFGSLTVSELQRTLQKHGFYIGYLIDGDFGYFTKVALQEYLRDKKYYVGYLIDGDFAYYSICAFQKYLANLGYYRYSIDGWWGTDTTKALQESLNDCKF